MRTERQGERGAAAILEAAVILPLVFLTLLSLMGISLYLCDATVTETLAEKYAALAVHETLTPGAASAFISRQEHPGDVWNQNTVAYLEQERRDTALFPGTPDYTLLCAAMQKEAAKTTFLPWENVSCNVTRDQQWGTDSVCVAVQLQAGTGVLSRLFPTCRACAEIRIGDPAETVRTTDLILDVVEDVSGRVNQKGGWGKLFSDVFQKE